MVKVKVYIKNNQKVEKIPVGIRLLIRKCCQAVLVKEEFEENAEVSVTFVSNKQIQDLNLEFRDINKETDVLSFPLGQDGKYDINPDTGSLQLGDIVISIEKAIEQANHYNHSIEREIGFLVTHSMFHLLGYDHVDGGLEATMMREKEESVLSMLGISRIESFVREDED